MQTVKEYFNSVSAPSIFSGIMSDLQKYANTQTLTNADICDLLIEKFGSMYVNGTPTIAGFTRAVMIWENSRKYYFDGLYNTTQLEYNPIYNVDATETTETTRTPNITREREHETDETLQYGHNVATSDGTTGTNQVTTYNNSSFVDDSKTIQSLTGSEIHSGTDTTQRDGTETETETGTETTETTIERSGNIGVTTTQQMIEAERNILNFDLLNIWLERFAERFFIPIYEMECF